MVIYCPDKIIVSNCDSSNDFKVLPSIVDVMGVLPIKQIKDATKTTLGKSKSIFLQINISISVIV